MNHTPFLLRPHHHDRLPHVPFLIRLSRHPSRSHETKSKLPFPPAQLHRLLLDPSDGDHRLRSRCVTGTGRLMYNCSASLLLLLVLP